jgi:threonine dehydratase
MVQKYVDDTILVSDEEIAEAMAFALDWTILLSQVQRTVCNSLVRQMTIGAGKRLPKSKVVAVA